MAYSQEQWKRAKFLFELGMSLGEIKEDCGISREQIGKKARAEGWEKDTAKQALKSDIMAVDKKKDTVDKEKDTLLPRIANLEDYEITILDDITTVDGVKKYVMSTAALSLIRKNQMLTRNTKQITEFETTYSDEGKPLMKKPVVIDLELSPSDFKAIDEGIDKNSITLEVAPRHAKSGDVNVNATAAVQNNITLKTLDDFYDV